MTKRESDDHLHMLMALNTCRAGVEKGQSPFGACIVRDGEVLATAHNQVWDKTDATAHAEIEAIRQACNKIDSVHLAGATIYSTTEPCPMCFGAIHWARISRLVFAARIEDAARFGFNELPVTNKKLKRLSDNPIEIVPDVLRHEALDLYQQWQERSGKAY